MRCLPGILRTTFLGAVVVWVGFALDSCGTTCVAGIFANGTGVVLVKNSTPPPACPFSTGMSTMNVAVGKSQICELCTASSQVQHVFITLKSIELHTVFSDSQDSSQWLKLAPQLLRKPRQIDLLSDSLPENLVQGAAVPASTYREVLLQFLPATPAEPDAPVIPSPCGDGRRNCLLMADGRVEELHFLGNSDTPELLLPLQYNESSTLAVVPGTTVNLQLTLNPQQVSAVSPSGSWQIQYVLVGGASVSKYQGTQPNR
jgi:Domain of unknown function (DUF4382)